MTFTNISGCDLSYYQGQIDFQKFIAYGFKFAILRCGYAVTKDAKFDANMAGLAGKIPLSVYHYYYPMYNARDQANSVIQILAPYKQIIRRVWLDLEFVETGAYANPEHWLTYRNTIESAGYQTGIYTRASWWDSRVGIYAAEFARRPLWAAQYAGALTLIPKGWGSAMIWQKGTPTIGAAAGVKTLELDFDVWNDDANFVAEWGIASPQTGGNTVAQWKCKINGLAVRDGNGTTHNQIDTLYIGDVVDAVQGDITGWLHISKITRANGLQIARDGWCSGSTLYMDPVTAPPAPVGTSNTVTFEWDSNNVLTGITVDGSKWVKA